MYCLNSTNKQKGLFWLVKDLQNSEFLGVSMYVVNTLFLKFVDIMY